MLQQLFEYLFDRFHEHIHYTIQNMTSSEHKQVSENYNNYVP